jgi:hypothetical protein
VLDDYRPMSLKLRGLSRKAGELCDEFDVRPNDPGRN